MTTDNEESKPKIKSLLTTYGHAVPAHLVDEPTVTMLFPRKTGLQLDDGQGFMQFNEGIQEVPQSLADHPHLKKSGVKHYNKAPLPNLASEAETIERLKARGYKVVEPTEDSKLHAAMKDQAEQEAKAPEGGPDRGKVPVNDAPSLGFADETMNGRSTRRVR